jgi:anthranilate phosphoribosyltransferase
VLLNAAAALAALDGAGKGLEDALAEGYARASHAVDSGQAAATLARWIEISRSIERS